jgi:hypothetical protein
VIQNLFTLCNECYQNSRVLGAQNVMSLGALVVKGLGFASICFVSLMFSLLLLNGAKQMQ